MWPVATLRAEKPEVRTSVIYEIRLYSMVPGRLDVAYDRFANHLPRLFQRHGIFNVGRWTAVSGRNVPGFVYLLAYKDFAAREEQWQGFYRDQNWWDIRAQTQGDEEAIERFDLYFLRPSPVWVPRCSGETTLGGVHDFISAEVALGKTASANEFLRDLYLPLLTRAGAQVMLVADYISGGALPKVALLIAWPDPARRASGWHLMTNDGALKAAMAEQRKTIGRAVLGATDVLELEPTEFALPLATLGYQAREQDA
jgi:hypothetical protein